MTKTEKSKITPGQIRQISGFVSDELKRMNLGFKLVQSFINDSQRVFQFKEDLGEIILKNGIVNNPFSSEQVRQARFYPKGWKATSVDQQLLKLVGLFPGINLSQVNGLAESAAAFVAYVPKTADGIALLPRLSFLGELWDIADPYGSGYGQICRKIFCLVANDRSFHNEEGSNQMDERHIRIFADVREKLEELEAITRGDVLVKPFNFGDLYAGYSPRNARWEAMNSNDHRLPLITAQVACLLLTMPDRLTAWGQLSIDCSGDEWDGNTDGRWFRCPCFYCDGSQIRFHTAHNVSDFGSDSGSPVVFRV